MEISGFAIDQDTTYALPGASVQIVGTGLGTVTDSSGHYYLNSSLITPASKILITYVGYIPAVVPADYVIRQNATGEDVATSLTPAPPLTMDNVIIPGKAGSPAGFNWLLYGVAGFIVYKILKGK